MADKGCPSNSNGFTDSEDDLNTVTMVDVLKAEEIMEENAEAVLGPGDDKNCTYNEGYLKRQALYSCLTCLPVDGTECSGICLACSYHCHGDHDLVELYTKRNFRCDCGNSAFKDRKCILTSMKSSTNVNNSYNQNFQGVYCSCHRPYPDPEDHLDDVMLQCIVCEDWFHTRHLDSCVPDEDDYAEMICGLCTDKLPFLQYYLGYSVTKVSTDGDNNESTVNVSGADENALSSSPLKKVTLNGSATDDAELSKDSAEQETKAAAEAMDSNVSQTNGSAQETLLNNDTEKAPGDNVLEVNKDEVAELNTTEYETATSPTKESEENKEKDCLLKSLKMLPRESGATYWPRGFRKLLCTCTSCLELYKNNGVSFLVDEDDTILFYEESRQKQSKTTQYERGMEALSSLDRVQQMEAILVYNDMKTHLSEYLAKFAENKKVVREEDIREFFSGMKARKRQKLDVPYNCR